MILLHKLTIQQVISIFKEPENVSQCLQPATALHAKTDESNPRPPIYSYFFKNQF
jgi:hypothetical protein